MRGSLLLLWRLLLWNPSQKAPSASVSKVDVCCGLSVLVCLRLSVLVCLKLSVFNFFFKMYNERGWAHYDAAKLICVCIDIPQGHSKALNTKKNHPMNPPINDQNSVLRTPFTYGRDGMIF
jgi:hypothetical protein